MKDPKSYLKFSALSKITFWDFYSLSNKDVIGSKYPIVSLKEVLKQRKGFITIDDSIIYKRCRAQVQAKGIILRDEIPGKEIKTKKQQVCKADDFLVAEIDAKVGGYGIVPDYLDGAIVSGHYFLFEIDRTKILTEYLGIVVKLIDFAKQVKATGSTNYAAIRPYHVLEYVIPLPTLEEQLRIVSAYNEMIESAEGLEKEAVELGKGFDKYLIERLGIQNITNKKEKRILNLVGFANIIRWDTLFILGSLPGLTAKFELKTFSQIITSLNKDRFGKSIRVDSSKHPNNNYLYIGMEHVEKATGRLLELPQVKGWDIKSQTLQVPKNFFIYGKLRPYLNKYWINNTEHENIICSSEFFVFDIQKDINKLFFKYVLSSKFIQDQITDKTSGARMPRINEDIFLNLQFPLPPIEIQNEISKCITESKEKIEENFKLIDIIKKQAHDEFEREIFNH